MVLIFLLSDLLLAHDLQTANKTSCFMLYQHYLAKLSFAHLLANSEITFLKFFETIPFWATLIHQISRSLNVKVVRFETFFSSTWDSYKLCWLQLSHNDELRWFLGQFEMRPRWHMKSLGSVFSWFITKISIFFLEHSATILLPFREISVV